MKPLSHCPSCNSLLKKIIQTPTWHEKYCSNNCDLEYHQYFDGDFDSDRLLHISFRTPHFGVYVYFENGYFPNISHIYSNAVLQKKGISGPLMTLKTITVMEIIMDLSKEQILKLDNKLQLLSAYV
jgi:hypothetical protein